MPTDVIVCICFLCLIGLAAAFGFGYYKGFNKGKSESDRRWKSRIASDKFWSEY